jgi:hypothetical protein
MMTEQIIDYACDHSSFGIKTPVPHIIRRDAIDNLLYLIKGKSDFIFVVGETGIGKTVLLNQLIEEYDKKFVIKLLLSPHSYYSKDIDYIRQDICTQLSWLLHSKDPDYSGRETTQVLTSLVHALSNHLKQKTGKQFLFVIDGLNSSEMENYKVEILALFPFHIPGITFIFACNSNVLEKCYKDISSASQKIISYPVPIFNGEEISSVLSLTDKQDINLVTKTFSPIPRVLIMLKGLMDTGLPLGRILETYDEVNGDIFELEWAINSQNIEKVTLELALLAYSPFKLSFKQLQLYVKSETDCMVSLLTKITFVNIDDSKINISSTGIKKFIQEKLSVHKEDVELLIEKIFNEIEMPPTEQFDFLKYNLIKEDGKTVIEKIDDKTIISLFEKTKSINFTANLMELRYKAGIKLKDIKHTLKSSHMLSLAKGISEISVLESQLTFLLNKKDFDSAYNLVENSISIEEKIQLLSLIALKQKKENGEVDSNHLNQIGFLLDKLEVGYLSSEASLKIASAIFPLFPEKSFNIIRQVDEFGMAGSNQSDYIYARLYAENLINNKDQLEDVNIDNIALGDEVKQSINKLRDSLKDIDTFSMLDKIETMDITSGDKISMLSDMLLTFKSQSNSQEILNKCLDLIIETTDFYLSCTSLHKLSCAFIDCKKSQLAKENLARFTMLLIKASTQGPTLDFVQASINIAEYEYQTSTSLARIKDNYNYIINSISDGSQALKALLLFEKSMLKIKIKSFDGKISSSKENYLDQIIKYSAQHFHLLKDSIEVQVSIDFVKALNWAKRINTAERAIVAQYWAINHYLETENFSSKSVLRALSDIPNYKIEYVRLAVKLAKKLNVIGLHDLSESDFEKFLKVKNKLLNNIEKSVFISHLIVAIESNDSFDFHSEEKRKNLGLDLIKSFESIDSSWHKIDIGYELATILREKNEEIANQIERRVYDLQNEENTIKSKEIKNAYVRGVNLSIRANNVLLRNGFDEANNISIILKLIKNLGRSIEAVKLLATLISSTQLHCSENLSSRLIEKHAIPMLDDYEDNQSKEYILAFYNMCPVIYKYDQVMFMKLLDQICDLDVYNNCVKNTINYIFEKILLNDPFYQTDNHGYKLTYVEIKGIFTLIKKFNTDWFVYAYLKRLTNALKVKSQKIALNKNQIADISSFYDSIISLFPMVGGIQHNGYKLLCQALKLSFINEKDKLPWQKLVNESWSLKNLADEIFTCSSILSITNTMPLNNKKDELKNIIVKLNDLNFTLEKLDLIEHISHSCKDICKASTKKLLEDAISLTVKDDPQAYENKRKELVDAIYDIDPKLSGSITSLFDDDPARKNSIEETIKSKRSHESIIENFDKNGAQNIKRIELNQFERYCSKRLAKLNASKDARMKRTEIISKLDNLNQFDEESLFPIISYLIEAHAYTFNHSKSELHKEMQVIFEGIISNMNLMARIYKIKSGYITSVLPSDEGLSLAGTEQDISDTSNFILKWSQEYKIDSFIISEPYFSAEDFKFIADVLNRQFDKKITIITSMEMYKKLIGLAKERDMQIDEYLLSEWKDNICPDQNPRIEVIFVGTKEREDGIVHDRWWLNGSGSLAIKLGTSINGIGNKICSINKLTISEANNAYSLLEPILNKTLTQYKDEKVTIRIAMLD